MLTNLLSDTKPRQMSTDTEKLEQLIALNEGKCNKVYNDTLGIPTIGIGRNLRDKGLSDDEVAYLFDNDVKECTAWMRTNLPWFDDLDVVRKAVLIDMRFNLGGSGLLGFKNTLELIKNKQYTDAAVAMGQSKWATQVGERAKRLQRMMAFGDWPPEVLQ